MEKKQTAVEWLKELSEFATFREIDWQDALQMEKEQLIECFNEADADAYRKEPKYKTPLDYIKATYEH